MNKRPTLRTVAEEAGVSLPTVSQVMRGVGRISDSTRKKVLLAAEQVGYVPDESAISMRTGRSNEVGIILHFISNHFNAELVNGVSSVLEPLGYMVSVHDAKDEDERVEQLVRSVLSRKPAGLLWVPGESVQPSLAQLIKKQDVPSITFLRDSGITEISNVTINNFEATYAATKHLISLGHRQLAYVGGMPRSQTRAKRYAGFLQAIQDAFLPEPYLINSIESRTIGFELIGDILQSYPDATGLVFYGDELAIGACLGMQRMGLEPGRDVSIVGFDDIEAASLLTPALTTLAINPFQFGKTLAELLIEEKNDPDHPIQQVVLEATLKERSTTSILEPSTP